MTLPEDFIKHTKAALGDTTWHILEQGLAAEPPVSIRLNHWKCSGKGWTVAGCDGEVPWCNDGFYLAARPNFTFDPMLHAGMYYVQEASSMFLDRVLRQYAADTPVRMLDLCAAPGGKSTVARAALAEGSLLVSNEPMRQRAQILAENMQKQGHPDAIVTNNYPQDFRRSGLTFDVILADVPCSGEGMFRKDPAAIGEWSVQNVEKCWRLQREIATDAWQCLRPGGLFIYSTCTFNTKEDEENTLYICEELGAEVLPVDIDNGWGITGSVLPGFDKPVYRFIPGKAKGEGLFMVVMRKPADATAASDRVKAKKTKGERPQNRNNAAANACAKWIKQPTDFEITASGTIIAAIPRSWKPFYDMAAKSLNIMSAGIPLGEVKGKDIVPSQALALSICLDTSAFPSAELDYGQALSYLRKEAVPLPEGTPRGHVLITYKGIPLGFEKNIGNRANNLYPAEWKIKSTHTPEGNNCVVELKINN